MKPNLPPLSLYIHIPWCIQKCPYCDFNSHALKHDLPQKEYIAHLIADLKQDLPLTQQRPLHSIFIGGGTPSLFDAENIAFLLNEIQHSIPFSPAIEITLEANPGTAEAEHFIGYQHAGVNRISMGIQSFNNRHLKQLGRIHNVKEAEKAIQLAKSLSLRSFNLDIMHGLPDQTRNEALTDLETMLTFSPPHFSWYQLTIEPNTLFASKPPQLPDDDVLWEIYTKGHEKLTQAGYKQYEISAYAKPGFECKHNLNYWRFGDYLGIGCGAHGKLTQLNGDIIRTEKTRHPKGYLTGNYQFNQKIVPLDERAFEFFMNRFRLFEPVPKTEFETLTQLSIETIQTPLEKAMKNGYLIEDHNNWIVTEKGKLFLNSLLAYFME